MTPLSEYKLKDIHIGMQVKDTRADFLGFIIRIEASKNIFVKDEYYPIITIRWIDNTGGYRKDTKYLDDCDLIYPTGNIIDLGV